ncbi:MAG: toll/interleukin-1 receptor domain-containing protein [Blastocatellia bacterium]
MSKKVFVSYSHKQSEWVRNRLIPCLRYGGAEMDPDYERFKAGLTVIGQMDRAQDEAEISVLVLSKDYLKSNYCRREMSRAIIRDPDFTKGSAIFVKRVECEMPEEIESAEPLWVNLVNDKDAAQWNLLLEACGADLGAAAPHWLARRDEVLQFLQRGQSVNLIVKEDPRWREMIEHLRDAHLPELRTIDLAPGTTASRRALVEELLKACGINQPVPAPPEDLVVLDRALSAYPTPSHVALLHADLMAARPDYDINLFSALRSLIMDARKLVLLVQSRRPFAQLVPHDHPLSAIDLKTVELTGRRR